MVNSRTILTLSEDETIRLGQAIGNKLAPGDIVFLMGDLGAGKTRLAKGIVSAATGADPDEVVSPTFTLINVFEGAFPVYHADLYRLESDQISGTGLEEALEESGAVVVEWGEKGRFAEGEQLRVTIEYTRTGSGRAIVMEWSPDGTWHDRIRAIMKQWVASQGVATPVRDAEHSCLCIS
ncbi:MAG: tRNA (adenosine(37)-N6)-threonylcarbamoyltransferase complex ATPase subunit type 1 TsaE [Desulfomonilaceae bacterium]|nr:tRNA (adenosine(37)-N6)-threonylcarbamoyltransferase complex ATPase subunit type 1 TsaE [Desulfomonilaceae bacterium]